MIGNHVVIGITGPTGAGKSTATEYLAGKGYAVIYCDAFANDAIAGDADLVCKIGEMFPGAVADGKIDRKVLGSAVFSDKNALQSYNRLVFPFLIDTIRNFVAALPADEPVVLDGATIIESGVDALCDTLIAVVCDRETRIKRILLRDTMDRQAAENRADSQPDRLFYMEKADYTLQNNRDRGSLYAAVDDIIRDMEG